MADVDLLKGMSKKSPPTQDASRKLPGRNIDSDATRSKTAATPPTLGPRTA